MVGKGASNSQVGFKRTVFGSVVGCAVPDMTHLRLAFRHHCDATCCPRYPVACDSPIGGRWGTGESGDRRRSSSPVT